MALCFIELILRVYGGTYLERIDLVSQVINAFLRSSNGSNVLLDLGNPFQQFRQVVFAKCELFNDSLLLEISVNKAKQSNRWINIH